jgi:hypothetical protein
MELREQERRAREEARKKLEADIASGKVQVIRNANGQLSIVGWQQQQAKAAGWCESCVLNSIQKEGSWAAKQKLAQIGQQIGARVRR